MVGKTVGQNWNKNGKRESGAARRALYNSDMTQPHHIDPAALISELIYLRKDRGVTASRLQNAPDVVYFLGGKEQVFETLKIRLTSAIQSLSDAQSRDALLSAYGLIPKLYAPILKDRRAKYGSAVGRKYDTLAAREDAAIEELVVRLLTAFYSGAPIPSTLPLPHGSYILESLTVATLMRNRQFVYHDQTRRVVSLTDRADRFEYHSSESTRLIALSGCSVDSQPVTNGTKHILQFGKVLRRGQRHTFSFREESDEPHNPDIKEDRAGQSFETPSYSYTQIVTFDGDIPKRIWWYDKMSWIERPGKPSKSRLLTLSDGVNTVRHEFTQQYGGFFSGIAWEW